MSDTFTIVLDHTEQHRAAALVKIDAYYAQLAVQQAHRDQAHAWKRGVASLVMDGAVLAESHPFAREASLRGLPPDELARDIVCKPDNFAKRELQRQKLLLAVSSAKTPAEIDGALASLN